MKLKHLAPSSGLGPKARRVPSELKSPGQPGQGHRPSQQTQSKAMIRASRTLPLAVSALLLLANGFRSEPSVKSSEQGQVSGLTLLKFQMHVGCDYIIW